MLPRSSCATIKSHGRMVAVRPTHRQIGKTVSETASAPAKQSNEDRKIEALRKKVEKAHDWRVQVWAQSERRIKAMEAELAVLGAPPVDLFDPDFSNPEMIEHYATMTLRG